MSLETTQLRRFADVEMDLAERRLLRAGRPLHLEPRAFDTLAYLVEHPGRLVRKGELLDALWPGMVVTENALTRAIAEVRKALKDDAHAPRYIQTVPRLGYRFVAPPAATDGDADATAAGKRHDDEPRLAAFGWAGGIAALVMIIMGGGLWLTRETQPPSPQPAPIRAPPQSIAVLPFQDFSKDPRYGSLGAGLAENLLDLLAGTPDLKVVARSSSFALRGQDMDARSVGQMLGVAWLLEGSVQEDEGRLRITVQLIDADTGYHAWSRRYDRELADVFALQDEIAGEVLAAVAPEIRPGAVARVPSSTSLEAYWQYLAGRQHLALRSAGWMSSARDAFAAALELDPEFAAAHAGLAAALALHTGTLDSSEGMRAQLEDARSAAERALAMDETLGLAHAAVGLVMDFEGAPAGDIEPLYRQAIRLDPALMEARNWLVGVLVRSGRFAAARVERHRALAIDPLNAVLIENESRDLESQGDREAATAMAERLLTLPQRPVGAYFRVAEVAAQFGDLVEFLRANRRGALEMEPPYDQRHLAFAAVALARLGLFEQAEDWLESASGLGNDIGWVLAGINVRFRAGEPEKAAAVVETWARSMGSSERHPPYVLGLGGVAAAWSDDDEATIASLEPLWTSWQDTLWGTVPGVAEPIEAFQLLAMAMRRVGRADDAQAVLERVHAELESQMRDYPARSPGAYYELGAVLTLLGRTRAAVEALATASDGGWSDYYRALHDPRWDAARSEPLFESVMTNALDDLERQRAELAALETGGEPLAVVPRLTAARGTP